MSEQKAPYSVGATATPSIFTSLDTPTVSGVKCVRVANAQPWREQIADLLNAMRGPHPRWAIIVWDGTAFQFREAKNIAQRIAVE